jgi:hypothetical protein
MPSAPCLKLLRLSWASNPVIHLVRSCRSYAVCALHAATSECGQARRASNDTQPGQCKWKAFAAPGPVSATNHNL